MSHALEERSGSQALPDGGGRWPRAQSWARLGGRVTGPGRAPGRGWTEGQGSGRRQGGRRPGVACGESRPRSRGCARRGRPAGDEGFRGGQECRAGTGWQSLLDICRAPVPLDVSHLLRAWHRARGPPARRHGAPSRAGASARRGLRQTRDRGIVQSWKLKTQQVTRPLRGAQSTRAELGAEGDQGADP